MEESSVDGLKVKGLLGMENGRMSKRSGELHSIHTGSGDADSSLGFPFPSSASLADFDGSLPQPGDADLTTKATVSASKILADGAGPGDQIDILVPFPASLPSQYKALVSQIETTKHPNYPFILRRVYEAGHLKSFLQYLDRRSEARDAEIERVCAEHTSTLTEAAKDLMAVSRGVEELRANLHADRKISGKQMGEISEAAKHAAACNNALVNTAQLIERISILKPVIMTVGEAQSCIDKGQLVRALRKLHDAWERTRKLPHHIRLVKSLADNIPFMKKQLIMEAKRGVTTALESARNANLKAGFLTLKNVCEVNELFIEPYVLEPGKNLSSKFADEIKFLTDRKWSIEVSVDLKPLLVFRHVMLTFEPDDLDEEALKNYCENYMTQRRHQISQMVQPPNHMHGVDHFRHYIQDIVGIFSLELYINNSVPGLTNESFFSELWNDTAPGVAAALSSNFVFMTDEDICAQIKNLMNLFAVALNFLHCDSTRIHGVLEDMRDHYGEILLRKLVAEMNEVLDVDNFIAVTVVDEADQQRVLGDFPFTLDTVESGAAQFPKQFPFSASVPKFYSLIQNYIATYVNFSRDLNLSQAEVDDKVRMSTNTVLSRNLRGCVCGKVEKGSLTVDQLVQAYTNCTYLEYSCQYLEEYIADLLKIRASGSTGGSTSTTTTGAATLALTPRLESESLFKDIRSQIEQQVYTSLMNSIEEMVSRFDSAAAPETSDKPSVLSTRVVRYLEVVFASIRKMPYSVCQTAWMTACKHITNQLQETFIHKSPMITIEGVQQLKNDLSFYEGFLLKQKDSADPSTLLLAFSDLRQSTDLLLLWDWNTYFHEYGKKDARYNRVQPQTALLILEKMKESDRKRSSVFQNLRKNERDKKKLLDTVTTQLKDLISDGPK